MNVSLSSRVWLGIVAGIIGALITGIILAVLGSRAGVFGSVISVSLIGSIVVGAIIGLIFGLIVSPTRNYVQSTLWGLVLGLVLWAALALVAPLFFRATLLTGFNFASLVSLLLFGVITSLAYSLIGNAFYNYEVGAGEREYREKPTGTMGGERKMFGRKGNPDEKDTGTTGGYYKKRRGHQDYNDRSDMDD